MEHEQYIEWMSAALDGEIAPAERQALEAHLAVCPECAALWQELRAQSAALRELDCEVPEGLKARILADLPPQEKPRRSPWRRWAAACACLVVVAAALTAAPRLMHAGSSAPPSAMSGTCTEDPAAPAESSPTYDINRVPEESAGTDAVQKWCAVAGDSLQLFAAARVETDAESLPEDGVYLLDSEDALADFLALFPAGDDRDLDAAEAPADLAQGYDSGYFADGQLAAIVLTSTGGREPVLQALTAQQAVVAFTQEERGGDEPSVWVILAPVDAAFAPDGDIELVYSGQ